MKLAILAGEAAGGLAGLDGVFDWGEATTVTRPEEGRDADVFVQIEAGEPAWPVRDELFDLPPADPAAGVLVVAGDDRAGTLVDRLGARGIDARREPELTADSLAAAAIVAFPPALVEEAHPAEPDPGPPSAAFAVLAARRLLIAPRVVRPHGLLPGSDHLAASREDQVVMYADALHREPVAFGLQRALGRIAAETRRASVVYGRVAVEAATA